MNLDTEVGRYDLFAAILEMEGSVIPGNKG
jgi:hypothetical protein